MLRDTYHAGDDLGGLLDPTRYGTVDHLERHLIARVLPAAYTPRPGRPPPRYSEAQARQALTFLARRMNQDHTRDLAWWHIPRWASTTPRVFTTGLAYGLAYGLAFGLVFGLVLGLVVKTRSEFWSGPRSGSRSGPCLGSWAGSKASSRRGDSAGPRVSGPRL